MKKFEPKGTTNPDPAMAFFDDLPEATASKSPEETAKVGDLFRINPKPEIKSKKFQVAMKPSLHKRIVKLAKRSGTSVNDYINQALEVFVSEQEKQ